MSFVVCWCLLIVAWSSLLLLGVCRCWSLLLLAVRFANVFHVLCVVCPVLSFVASCCCRGVLYVAVRWFLLLVWLVVYCCCLLRGVCCYCVSVCVFVAVCYVSMVAVSCYGAACVLLLGASYLLFVIGCLLVVVCLSVKLLARLFARRLWLLVVCCALRGVRWLLLLCLA